MGEELDKLIKLTKAKGFTWYKNIAVKAPKKLIIAGNNLIKGFKENSASIKVKLLGWVNKELAKKLEPTPT